MAVHNKIEYEKAENLFLDQKNPRLGRHNVDKGLGQDEILKLMQKYTLDELVVSIAHSGFWPQEAVIVVEDKVGKADRKVVVEGNRRLAAAKLLDMAIRGLAAPSDVSEVVDSLSKKELQSLKDTLNAIPYIRADDRKDVKEYLGFRHVTGIKQWDPAEKAEYIAELIDSGMTYQDDEIDVKAVENKFSVLTLSLRTDGVQSYLGIDIEADPADAKTPVPRSKLRHLVNFALWLFGKEGSVPPIITDSRKVDTFGKILESAKAVEYLESSKSPRFEVAKRLAGGDESEVVDLIEEAAFSIEEALSTLHLVKDSKRVKEGVERLIQDIHQVLLVFPELKKHICGKEKQ